MGCRIQRRLLKNAPLVAYRNGHRWNSGTAVEGAAPTLPEEGTIPGERVVERRGGGIEGSASVYCSHRGARDILRADRWNNEATVATMGAPSTMMQRDDRWKVEEDYILRAERTGRNPSQCPRQATEEEKDGLLIVRRPRHDRRWWGGTTEDGRRHGFSIRICFCLVR